MGYSFDDCGDEFSCKDQEIAEKCHDHTGEVSPVEQDNGSDEE